VTEQPDERVTAIGIQLVEVHNWIRHQLTGLRASLGGSADNMVRPGPDLLLHCLSFCSVLSAHHADEDGNLFPALAQDHPELAAVLAELGRDHEQVAGLIRSVRVLVDDLDPGPSAVVAAAAELDGLAALLESHFGYEERKLAGVLHTLRPQAGLVELTRVLPAGT
jgi:hemerythrin-like domain-containing protein